MQQTLLHCVVLSFLEIGLIMGQTINEKPPCPGTGTFGGKNNPDRTPCAPYFDYQDKRYTGVCIDADNGGIFWCAINIVPYKASVWGNCFVENCPTTVAPTNDTTTGTYDEAHLSLEYMTTSAPNHPMATQDRAPEPDPEPEQYEPYGSSAKGIGPDAHGNNQISVNIIGDNNSPIILAGMEKVSDDYVGLLEKIKALAHYNIMMKNKHFLDYFNKTIHHGNGGREMTTVAPSATTDDVTGTVEAATTEAIKSTT